MLKRSSSSSLRLWTRTQRGGAFFVSDKTEIVFFESSFFRGRESKGKKERVRDDDDDGCTRLHERERNDPFEPDDDDAKISLTFFLSSSSVSQNTQDYTHYWAHARAHKKKPNERRLVVLVFFLSLVFLARCFFWRQSRAARNALERLHRQILFFFLARKKK